NLAVAGTVGLGKFLKEERVALSPLADRTELGRGCIAELGQCLEQLKRVIRTKRCQFDGGDVRPPRQCRKERPQAMPAMKLVTPVTPHDQIRGRGRLGDEKLQDGQGSLVGPVQVLNQENGGRGAEKPRLPNAGVARNQKGAAAAVAQRRNPSAQVFDLARTSDKR